MQTLNPLNPIQVYLLISFVFRLVKVYHNFKRKALIFYVRWCHDEI